MRNRSPPLLLVEPGPCTLSGEEADHHAASGPQGVRDLVHDGLWVGEKLDDGDGEHGADALLAERERLTDAADERRHPPSRDPEQLGSGIEPDVRAGSRAEAPAASAEVKPGARCTVQEFGDAARFVLEDRPPQRCVLPGVVRLRARGVLIEGVRARGHLSHLP